MISDIGVNPRKITKSDIGQLRDTEPIPVLAFLFSVYWFVFVLIFFVYTVCLFLVLFCVKNRKKRLLKETQNCQNVFGHVN